MAQVLDDLCPLIKVRVKASKTNPTWQGVDLFMGRTWNSLCPVVAMLRYSSEAWPQDHCSGNTLIPEKTSRKNQASTSTSWCRPHTLCQTFVSNRSCHSIQRHLGCYNSDASTAIGVSYRCNKLIVVPYGHYHR